MHTRTTHNVEQNKLGHWTDKPPSSLFGQPGQRLARRYLVFTLLFSSLLTAMFCISDVLAARTERLTAIDQAFKRLQSFYGPHLSNNLWQVQHTQLESLLAGIVANEPLDFIRVSEKNKQWVAGQPASSVAKEHRLVLKYVQGDESVFVGEVYAVAGTTRINQHLTQLGAFLILRNFLKSVAMVLISYWLFHHLIHRHLERISGAIQVFHPQRDGDDISLESGLLDRRNTELDELVASINKQQRELRQNYQVMKSSQVHLEQALTERTEQLGESHRRLLRAEKMALVGHMVASVAHELRNPLGVVKNSGKLIQMLLNPQQYPPLENTNDEPRSVTVQNAMLRLLRGVDRCDRLIAQLREYSSLQPATAKNLDLVSWVRQFCDYDVDWPSGSKYQMQGEASLWCEFDPHQLELVLGNLLSNALHAMATNNNRPSFLVTITILSSDNDVNLLVEDLGGGISLQDTKRIMEPFFSTKTTGFGLGLSIVQKACEAQGGSLSFSNTAQGCVFCVSLPNNTQEMP